ncbi:esterase/lipase [Tahibacter aquaticus]|uniref:Esterase/lipase n=1 Tax=Tahibacter aquaticus TaxID=520092 RepID=A0A4R6YTF2_9GAMM|nr:alpha/beta hydrolase [Tahibacter aquaticus]TDR41669.1 esterase/lipase [Tahibacter aquaticus]
MPSSCVCPPESTLAIHGAGGGGWEWAIWQRVWRAHAATLYAPDLQPLAAGLGATLLDDYLAQMRAAASGLSRPVIVGASLGGLIALAIARQVQARGLVLVNPLPPAGIAPRPGRRVDTAGIIPWASRRRLASSQRSLPDADDAAVLYAFRHWRDESAAVLDQAVTGLNVELPDCRILVIASSADGDVPTESSRNLAAACAAQLWILPGVSHTGPLLGRDAAALARRVLGWTQAETFHTSPSQVPLQTE